MSLWNSHTFSGIKIMTIILVTTRLSLVSANDPIELTFTESLGFKCKPAYNGAWSMVSKVTDPELKGKLPEWGYCVMQIGSFRVGEMNHSEVQSALKSAKLPVTIVFELRELFLSAICSEQAIKETTFFDDEEAVKETMGKMLEIARNVPYKNDAKMKLDLQEIDDLFKQINTLKGNVSWSAELCTGDVRGDDIIDFVQHLRKYPNFRSAASRMAPSAYTHLAKWQWLLQGNFTDNQRKITWVRKESKELITRLDTLVKCFNKPISRSNPNEKILREARVNMLNEMNDCYGRIYANVPKDAILPWEVSGCSGNTITSFTWHLIVKHKWFRNYLVSRSNGWEPRGKKFRSKFPHLGANFTETANTAKGQMIY
jgi:hypothetical protein